MKRFMVITEYLTGSIAAYEFTHREYAEYLMEFYPLISRRITLMQRAEDGDGSIWEGVYYIDKEGRHDLSE